MSKWFVNIDTVRLDLSGGEWIEVKKELTYGEQKRLQSAGMGGTMELGGNKVDVDWAVFEMAKLEAYLVDWSARDRNDKPLPVNRQNIEALSSAMAQEITEALEAFQETTLETDDEGNDDSVPETVTRLSLT